jgi:hypothetical protein
MPILAPVVSDGELEDLGDAGDGEKEEWLVVVVAEGEVDAEAREEVVFDEIGGEVEVLDDGEEEDEEDDAAANGDTEADDSNSFGDLAWNVFVVGSWQSLVLLSIQLQHAHSPLELLYTTSGPGKVSS